MVDVRIFVESIIFINMSCLIHVIMITSTKLSYENYTVSHGHKLCIFMMKIVVLHIHQASVLFGLIIVKHKSQWHEWLYDIYHIYPVFFPLLMVYLLVFFFWDLCHNIFQNVHFYVTIIYILKYRPILICAVCSNSTLFFII